MPLPRPLVAIERASGSLSEICWSGVASILASSFPRRRISSFNVAIFSVRRLVLVVRARRLLPVGAVQLVQVANTLLDLRHAALYLGPREVLVPGVHRLELGTVDRHAGIGQIKPAAESDKLNTDFTDRVFAELGRSFVIRRQAAGQPHYFHIAPGFAPAARLNPVEIAVNIDKHAG